MDQKLTKVSVPLASSIFYFILGKLNQKRRILSKSIIWEKKVLIPKLTLILTLNKSSKKSQNPLSKFNRKRKKSNLWKKLQSKLIKKDASVVKRKLVCWESNVSVVLFTAALTDFLNNIHASSTIEKLPMTDLNNNWSKSTMARLRAFDYFFSFIYF